MTPTNLNNLQSVYLFPEYASIVFWGYTHTHTQRERERERERQRQRERQRHTERERERERERDVSLYAGQLYGCDTCSD